MQRTQQQTLHPQLFGPSHVHRRFTDGSFLFIFVIWICVSMFIGLTSWLYGDYYRMIYGVDSWGNTCNRNNKKIANVSLSGLNMVGKTNVFHYHPQAADGAARASKNVVMCLDKCPDELLLTLSDLAQYANTTGTRLCRYDVPPAEYTSRGGDNSVCPPLPLRPHHDVLHHCVPVNVKRLGEEASPTKGFVGLRYKRVLHSHCNNASSFFVKMAHDLRHTWPIIISLYAIATVLSVIFVFLIRNVALFCIRAIAICALGGLFAVTGVCWFMYNVNSREVRAIALLEREYYDTVRVNVWLTFALLVSVFAFTLLAISCIYIISEETSIFAPRRLRFYKALRVGACTVGKVVIVIFVLNTADKMRSVAKLLREASGGVVRMPTLFVFPFCTIPLTFAAIWVLALNMLCIASAGSPVVEEETGFIVIKSPRDTGVRYAQCVGIVLWCIAFVCGCQDMITAGSMASWYYIEYKHNIRYPVLRSIYRLARYHAGSVAAGALIVLPVQFIDTFQYHCHRRLMSLDGNLGRRSRDCLFRIHSGIYVSFENIIKFLNRNALIGIAIRGWRYCASARFAIILFRKKASLIGCLTTVTTLFLFLFKLIVVSIIFVAGAYWLKDNNEVCHMFVPLSLAMIGSYAIASTFIGIYRVAVDTILLCALEDMSINYGARNYYSMSPGLMELLELRNGFTRFDQTDEAALDEDHAKVDGKAVAYSPGDNSNGYRCFTGEIRGYDEVMAELDSQCSRSPTSRPTTRTASRPTSRPASGISSKSEHPHHLTESQEKYITDILPSLTGVVLSTSPSQAPSVVVVDTPEG